MPWPPTRPANPPGASGETAPMEDDAMRKFVTSVAGILALLAAMLVVTAEGAAAAPYTGKPVLSTTPYLGWNTYYGARRRLRREAEVRKSPTSLSRAAWREAGYDIVWLDGGWQAEPPRSDRRATWQADPDRFPNGMKRARRRTSTPRACAPASTPTPARTSPAPAVSAATATTSATPTSSRPGGSTRSRSTSSAGSPPTSTRGPCTPSSRQALRNNSRASAR